MIFSLISGHLKPASEPKQNKNNSSSYFLQFFLRCSLRAVFALAPGFAVDVFAVGRLAVFVVSSRVQSGPVRLRRSSSPPLRSELNADRLVAALHPSRSSTSGIFAELERDRGTLERHRSTSSSPVSTPSAFIPSFFFQKLRGQQKKHGYGAQNGWVLLHT